jgi:hypothetical protein
MVTVTAGLAVDVGVGVGAHIMSYHNDSDIFSPFCPVLFCTVLSMSISDL